MNDTGRGEAPPEEPKTPLERIKDVKKAAQTSKDLGFAIETVSKLETLVRFAEKYITSDNPSLKMIAGEIEVYFENLQRDDQEMPMIEFQKKGAARYADWAEELFRKIEVRKGEKGFTEDDFKQLLGER
jgi:hypothetical protein